MNFWKYHGIGNDFVMLLDLDDRLSLSEATVCRLCHRHKGIGGDGVIRVTRTADSDLFMDYINSDGTVGTMCGNGVRCVAAFARDKGLVTGGSLRIGTRSGTKEATLLSDGRVRVDMGPPAFEPSKVPVLWEGDDALAAKFEVGDTFVEVACLSMGNTHGVIFVDDLETAPVTTLGAELEFHPMFPRRANIEFARVIEDDRIEMRVWELGAQETMACGSGACAVAVVARLQRGTAESVTVLLPGGELEIEWRGSQDAESPVFMTGEATRAFEGTLEWERYADA